MILGGHDSPLELMPLMLCILRLPNTTLLFVLRCPCEAIGVSCSEFDLELGFWF